jgi:hypothetical protein
MCSRADVLARPFEARKKNFFCKTTNPSRLHAIQAQQRPIGANRAPEWEIGIDAHAASGHWWELQK